MFPTSLLSDALFPVQDLPSWLVPVCYANPLTYGVDGTVEFFSEIAISRNFTAEHTENAEEIKSV